MSRTSHFTTRTQLGTAEDDILIAGRGKRERLYGGAGDDLLVSVDGGDYAHGGSGADIFAFRFNKNIRRSAKRGKTVDHVIEDFNLDEGDKICLSHLVTKSQHKNIDYRGSGRIKGSGIEVRLAQGKQGAAREETEAFSGIEDGVSQTLGELPEISKTRRKGADSRLEVYEDGILISNITLKNNPGSKSFSKKLRNAIFGKYSQTTKEVTSAEGMTGSHLSAYSITSKGVPYKGSGSKIDIGNDDSQDTSALTGFPGGQDSLEKRSQTIADASFKPTAALSATYNKKLRYVKPLGYKFGVGFKINAGIAISITVHAGDIASAGNLNYAPDDLQVKLSEEIFEGVDASASGGLSLTGSLNVSEEGLGKIIVSKAAFNGSAQHELEHDGLVGLPSLKLIEHNSVFKSRGAEVKYSNSKKDGITGLSGSASLTPHVNLSLGIGLSDGDLTANLLSSGPELKYPLTLEVGDRFGFSYGPAEFNWTTSLITINDPDIPGMSFTAKNLPYNIANFGAHGFEKFYI